MKRLVDKTLVWMSLLVIVPIVLIYVTGMHIWYWITGKGITEVK